MSGYWGGATTFSKPRAVARCALVRKRAHLICPLPAQQRGNLVGDSVAGLYVAGGTAVFPSTLGALPSDLAAGPSLQIGRVPSGALRSPHLPGARLLSMLGACSTAPFATAICSLLPALVPCGLTAHAVLALSAPFLVP